VEGEDRVLVVRAGVPIAGEEAAAGARAILSQEMTCLCNPKRKGDGNPARWSVRTDSACVLLPRPRERERVLLCAAFMSEGLICHCDDFALLDGRSVWRECLSPIMLP
jgi:hypothetical protein